MSRLSFLTLALLVGCSSSSFDVLGTPDATGDDTSVTADTGATTDTGVAEDTSVVEDTSVTTDTGTTETAPTDGGCATEAPDGTAGLFASPSGSDTAGDGSAAKPFQTIALAQTKARAAGKVKVYLDQGTYAEAVVIADGSTGIVIEGGWKKTGATWGRDCGAGARASTIIASPTSPAVLFEKVKTLSGLRRLTVKTKPKGATVADTAGESLIGVFIRGNGSRVALDDVEVIAGDAGDGGAAKAGVASAALACTTSCSTGASGTSSGPGAPASIPGGYGGSGFLPSDGSPGVKGGDGKMGTIFGYGGLENCVDDCPAVDCSLACPIASSTPTYAPNGTCGCGGIGGAPGGPGRGGGASIGLYANGDALDLQLVNVKITAGNGGKGSAGGLGADGAMGSPGKAGEDKTCNVGCNHNPTTCACQKAYPTTIKGGAAGGTGGAGGRGGNGGAGAGGPSWSLVAIGASPTVSATDVTYVHGVGGDGSIAGLSGDRFP